MQENRQVFNLLRFLQKLAQKLELAADNFPGKFSLEKPWKDIRGVRKCPGRRWNSWPVPCVELPGHCALTQSVPTPYEFKSYKQFAKGLHCPGCSLHTPSRSRTRIKAPSASTPWVHLHRRSRGSPIPSPSYFSRQLGTGLGAEHECFLCQRYPWEERHGAASSVLRHTEPPSSLCRVTASRIWPLLSRLLGKRHELERDYPRTPLLHALPCPSSPEASGCRALALRG